MIAGDEDPSGGPRGESGRYEIWLLPGAIGYVGEFDYYNDASGGSV